ncbi:MAG TPA: MaoC family dehydratase N-terminal domain-containing protein [Stellaceae bacterium]|nr:MaoC family dehydratase N-terminal domain-containing protein [Stellaceae bacterium]
MGYESWLGRSETREDTIPPALAGRLAVTLGVPEPADGSLPPLGHWTLFQDWLPAEALGADGHPRRGGFLPPVHELPRRMWAGGRIEVSGALLPGDAVRRTSTILAIEEKAGRSGLLVFVTVGHLLDGPRGPVLVEEHDIVYSAVASAARPAEPATPPPQGALVEERRPDSVTLFRYSALTGNGHRIHYDLDYARGVESYPGLVVHGPLQATWLAHLVMRVQPGRRLARFAFRGRRPAFHDRILRLEARSEGGGVTARSRDDAGAVLMTAQAELV